MVKDVKDQINKRINYEVLKSPWTSLCVSINVKIDKIKIKRHQNP